MRLLELKQWEGSIMYRKITLGWHKSMDFMFLDMLCLHISFLCAFWFRFGLQNPYANYRYGSFILVLSLIQVLVVVFFNLWKDVTNRGYYIEFTVVVKQACLMGLLTTFYLFTMQSGIFYSRLMLFLLAAVYVIMGYIVRILWKAHIRDKVFIGRERSLLIVTSSDLLNVMLEDIKAHNFDRFQIAGISVIDKDMRGQEMEGVKIVANGKDVASYICRGWIDEVFINLPEHQPCPGELLEQFQEMGVVIHMKLAKTTELMSQTHFVEQIGSYTVQTVGINCATTGQLFAKRLMDIAGGVVGCLITCILLIFLAPVIYIKSPGPIFFSQIRVGKNGKKFRIHKFRSMYMDAEERKLDLMADNRVSDGMMFKLDWDPRIIGSKRLEDGTIKKGIGNYIRDWSLDEFPQFLNVLRGEMSLVGTRPPTVDEWEKYDFRHRARLATKPGITGMWQVSGRSEITDFEEVVKLDKKYIAEWNMGLDIKMLLKTVAVVLRKEGSM